MHSWGRTKDAPPPPPPEAARPPKGLAPTCRLCKHKEAGAGSKRLTKYLRTKGNRRKYLTLAPPRNNRLEVAVRGEIHFLPQAGGWGRPTGVRAEAPGGGRSSPCEAPPPQGTQHERGVLQTADRGGGPRAISAPRQSSPGRPARGAGGSGASTETRLESGWRPAPRSAPSPRVGEASSQRTENVSLGTWTGSGPTSAAAEET